MNINHHALPRSAARNQSTPSLHCYTFAGLLAKEKKAELLTGGPEFKQVEGEIKIAWLK